MADWPYNTTRWLRLRRDHLAIEPLCRGCKPRVVVANTVDHIVPVNQGGDPFPDHSGLASYCAACHSAKTARGSEAGAVRSDKPRKGCDANGNPIDPAHPWNQGPGGRSDLETRTGLRPPPNLRTQLVHAKRKKDERSG